MKCTRALFSVCLSFFCDIAVGVGDGDERDQSAPAQTAPQQAGFGSDSTSACWLSVLLVIVLGGDMGYSSWFVKGIRHAIIKTILLRVVGSDAPDSFTAYYYY